MGLRIWLPLNEDIRNQGLSDWIPTLDSGTTATYVDGKIGKALNTGGIKMPADIAEDIMNGNEFSYTCWLYVNNEEGSTTGRPMIFGNDASRRYSLFQYPTCNDLHYSFRKTVNGSENTFASGVLTGVLPSYKWVHIAMTYKNPEFKIYINGVEAHSKSFVYDEINFRYETQVIHNSPYHYLNDVRIYDHCLSQKEVKFISQGLILHYTLEGTGGDNIAKGTSPNEWTSLVLTDTTNKCIYLNTTANYFSIPSLGVKTGDKIYVSFDIKFSQDITATGTGTAKSLVQGNDNRGGTWHSVSMTGGNRESYIKSILESESKEGRVETYFTVQSGELDGTYSGETYINIRFDYYTGTVYVRNVKIEVGDHSTFWTPNSGDIAYSTLGFDDGIEYDCSGYGNDGTRVGTLSWSNDTPRYQASTVIPTGANYINAGRGAMVSDAITVSMWCKYSTWGNPISCTESGGWNFENGGSSAGVRFPVYVDGVGYKLAQSGITIETLKDAWHMVTGTFDKTNVKIYIDGVLKGTTATDSTNGIKYNTNNVLLIGAEVGGGQTPTSNTFVGNISDVRVYATALSADDIMELYHTSASIDNKGNLHTYEVVEV